MEGFHSQSEAATRGALQEKVFLEKFPVLLIYGLRLSQPEPARATQNHPELAGATQESPRASQS